MTAWKAYWRAVGRWHNKVNEPKWSENTRAYYALESMREDMETTIRKWRNRGFWARVFNLEP